MVTRKLLSYARTGDVFTQADTLDAAWAEAEAIGRTKVETRFDRTYEATINFETGGGSNVFSHGRGATPVEALRAAIREALRVGG